MLAYSALYQVATVTANTEVPLSCLYPSLRESIVSKRLPAETKKYIEHDKERQTGLNQFGLFRFKGSTDKQGRSFTALEFTGYLNKTVG